MTSSRPAPDYDYFVEDLRVLDIDASVAHRGKRHVLWAGTVGPLDAQDPDGLQVVIMSLHVGAPSGGAEVTVGGIFTAASERSKVNAGDPALIATSSALESLYDFARLAIRSAAGLVDFKVNAPRRSPMAEISIFSADEATPSAESADATPE